MREAKAFCHTGIDYAGPLYTIPYRRRGVHKIKAYKGTVVILKSDNSTPLDWLLGVIDDVHPGKDGVARVVDVRTASGRRRAVVLETTAAAESEDNITQKGEFLSPPSLRFASV
ncbi:hypothetical protein EVAR_60895_1 [Eumeta japonica]|uniref:DUF5641 domain-containing protein n=1 Tax=Eumeta variegata TaxID=151549 RepID=A0A4C1YKL2_EUMVA|nr:hypothetical protein EVAR_60895_1 [Eumeta japonica]